MLCRELGARGREVFVYFDNDAKVHAPADARGLMARLGVSITPRDLPQATGRRRPPAGPDVIAATASADPRWRLGRRRHG